MRCFLATSPLIPLYFTSLRYRRLSFEISDSFYVEKSLTKMAANDQGFATRDLQQLKSHLLELKLAYSQAPSRRPEGTNNKSHKTAHASVSDTKEAVIEKVESDLKAIASSVFPQGEHSNFRLPASKASRDLYSKLKDIRDRDLTGEDISQVHSLLTSFVRELDPEHPFLSAPKEIFLRGKTLCMNATSRNMSNTCQSWCSR